MKIKEIFYSIQGEGFWTGRPAVFCRFAGCNLWSGLERDRSSAICKFCDTDFRDGYSRTEDQVAEDVIATWTTETSLSDCAKGNTITAKPFVIFTGGEPGLQLTGSLIDKLYVSGFFIAVETNGTIELPTECNPYWVTMSPKAGTLIKQKRGHEIKVVWPQDMDLRALETLDFKYRFLQPMHGHPGSIEDTKNEVLKNPGWWLSLQTHKILNVR